METLCPAEFIAQANIRVEVLELRANEYQVRLERRVDRSTVSFVMRNQPQRPSLLAAFTELQWLFQSLTPQARTWNRLMEFFTEDEGQLLRSKPVKENLQSDLDTSSLLG